MNDHKFKLLTLAIVGIIGISIALMAPNPVMSAPPGNPPSANVSPTFSGLIVNGLIRANNGINLYNSSLTDTYNSVIEIGGGIQLDGTITDKDGEVWVVGNMNLYNGELRNSATGQNITINDGLNVTGNVYDSNSYFTIDDGLNVTGTVYDSGSDFTIGDNLDVTGNISVTGSSASIGSYYTNWKEFSISGSMAAAGNPGEAGYQVACESGDYIVGCSAASIWIESDDRFLGTKILDPRTCSGRADDGASNDDLLHVFARCFDPNGSRSGEYQKY